MSLEKLFHHQLNILVYVEHQLKTSLPKVLRHTTYVKLKNMLSNHLTTTNNHIKRLEKVENQLQLHLIEEKYIKIHNLIHEVFNLVSKDKFGINIDRHIVTKFRDIKYSQISLYSEAVQLSTDLNYTLVTSELQKTLTDHSLNNLLINGMYKKMTRLPAEISNTR